MMGSQDVAQMPQHTSGKLVVPSSIALLTLSFGVGSVVSLHS